MTRPKSSSTAEHGDPADLKESSDWHYGLAGASAAVVICLAIFAWTWLLSRLTTGI